MGFVYFVLIYNWLSDKINSFGMSLMAHLMTWASGIALVLVTLWIMIQGYRMITGQSRDSMMAMVTNMTRIALIVTAATTMSIFGASLHTFLTTNLSTEINQLFTGNSDTTAQTIDQNLAWTQLALGAIDAVQIPAGDTENNDAKNHAMMMAGFGTASPPMAAAAMLLLYQFTMALFIGLGPLFILCLIFDQTKDLFRKWLMYGIGTLFSMAALAFVSSMVLQLTLRVAAALWTATTINTITGQTAEGFSSQALQQGGLGLLMTVLIISVPPMAAAFFQGTMGNFMHFSAFGGGAASQPGPQGQPPGSYGYGGYGPSQASTGLSNLGHQAAGGPLSNANAGTRGTIAAGPAQLDTIKTPPVGRG
ncbi:MAG TPA: type IV secretion system protein [Rhodanobacter sp.]|nr:type IV secretion system protein [Rhodanobacter sp.]